LCLLHSFLHSICWTEFLVIFLIKTNMSQTDIYYRIRRILSFNFNVEDHGNLYTASLNNQLGLSPMELNLLLYHIEQSFNIKLKDGLETEVSSLNQLVSYVSHEVNRKNLN
jgi:acyl carrier protein